MSPGDEHVVDMRLAQHQLMLALVTLLALSDDADQIKLQAGLVDGRMTVTTVDYYAKGKPLGGFAR